MFQDYTPTPSGSPSAGAGEGVSQDNYLALGKLKRQYTAYITSKRNEIDEQIEARRYRHGAQLTAEQRKTLKDRKQPPVIYNRIRRKIDGIVGLIEKMRQDPKAYPRTPKHEEGADLATATLRYVLDEQEWKAKSPIVAADGATVGIGGIEIIIEQGDQGDPEIGFEVVEGENFFYDPRSFRLDFSDATYMGVGKWVDLDVAKDMFPDKADQLATQIQNGADLTSNTDRDLRWYQTDREAGSRVRIIEHWYKRKGEWFFCIYTGTMKLMEGKSYLSDEKGKTTCKYLMFSSDVDQDGDRYGFVRQLRDAQDEINARRSKGLHELNTRRIIGEVGAFDDLNETRREAAKPDGIVLRNKGFEGAFDDTHKLNSLEGQLKFLEEAKNEIENFGPNPALIGQGIENKSGRAIALLQQAGIAELGPYILAYRGWKVRVYRALWCAVQKHWTAERWIRVTDDDQVAQFIQVNGMQRDPHTGFPEMVNQLGSLDVDIILDEGPDALNIMADAYDTLSILAQQGNAVPPQVLIELSPLNGTVKKKVLQMMSQPNPMAEQAKQIEMAGEAAKVEETKSKTELNYAKAMEAGRPEAPQQMEAPKFEMPPELQMAEKASNIRAANAKADHTAALADQTRVDTALAPHIAVNEIEAAQRAAQKPQPI
jgi:hypothetical protein